LPTARVGLRGRARRIGAFGLAQPLPRSPLRAGGPLLRCFWPTSPFAPPPNPSRAESCLRAASFIGGLTRSDPIRPPGVCDAPSADGPPGARCGSPGTEPHWGRLGARVELPGTSSHRAAATGASVRGVWFHTAAGAILGHQRAPRSRHDLYRFEGPRRRMPPRWLSRSPSPSPS
jgi:hypothetical protein